MKKKIQNIKDLPVIGWREWVKLPDLGIKRIKAKVDTGARSSAIYAYDLNEFSRDGDGWVRFKIHPQQRSTKEVIVAESKILEYRLVKNTGGKSTRRPVIITNITLLDSTWQVELTLANRDEMGFRMLLGREAFRGRYLVDAGGSYYGGKPKRKKKGTKKHLSYRLPTDKLPTKGRD
ncbi:MAG: RimK/LysX family protein [Planctomycetota bacterium]